MFWSALLAMAKVMFSRPSQVPRTLANPVALHLSYLSRNVGSCRKGKSEPYVLKYARSKESISSVGGNVEGESKFVLDDSVADGEGCCWGEKLRVALGSIITFAWRSRAVLLDFGTGRDGSYKATREYDVGGFAVKCWSLLFDEDNS